MNHQPFVIERSYQAPVQKVWAALTNKEQMKEWYFDLDRFDAKVGFEFTFSASSEGVVYVHHCRILEVVPGEKLSHTWRYQDYPGESVVTWELFPEGAGTRVKLTHSGLETFPANLKDFRRESFAQGWSHILGISLNGFLDRSA